MREYFGFTAEQLGEFLLVAVAAVAVLIIGFIVAKFVSSLVKKLFDKMQWDDRVAAAFSGSHAANVDIEKWIARVVFWIIMLMAFVAALQIFQLSFVTEPLNEFLGVIFAYIPKIIGAVGLIVLAWLVATAVRFLTRKALVMVGIDSRFQAEIARDPNAKPVAARTAHKTDTAASDRVATDSLEGDSAAAQPVSETVSTAAYYLIWLLFLPAILGVLDLEGLLGPVENMVNEALNFLPNLLAAIVIGVVGFFIARLIQRIVVNISAAAGVDRLSEEVGMHTVLGSQRLSQTLGIIVYVLVLIPVIIAALNALSIEAITAPASSMLNLILEAIPLIFAAALVLIVAYVVGKVVSGLVANLLHSIGFDRMLSNLGLVSSDRAGVDGRRPSDIVGGLVLLAIILFAAMEAAGILEFDALYTLLAEFLVLGGQILLGLVIFGLGLYLANLAYRAIVDADISDAHLVATSARLAIIVLAAAMALRHMGLANSIINMAFGLLLGAVAVAAAIAYGWGGRDLAREHLERLRAKKKSPGPTLEKKSGGSKPPTV